MYRQHAPRTEAGQLAWRFFLDIAWRVRVAGMGTIVGVETASAIERLVGTGVDRSVAEDLIGACEAGFLKAIRDEDGDGNVEN